MKTVPISIVLCFAFTYRTLGQVHDRYENVCPSLRDANPRELLQFLVGTTPDDANGWCVTWAIHKIGIQHYEPAIPVLVKFLAFKRPPTHEETMGFYLRPQITDELFPAAEALELIGKNALPEILRAIEAASTSDRARANALSVWMEAYKYERPKGIYLLRKKKIETDNDQIKSKLKWAIQKALAFCNPSEKTACQEAAAGQVSTDK